MEREKKQAQQARDDNQARILARGEQLAKQLGCGEVAYRTAKKFENCGYTEHLIIAFADVERILSERTAQWPTART